MSSLSCNNLSLSVGPAEKRLQLLDAFNADFSPSDVVCLLGQNGSGKTRLLHTLAGLIKPDNGEILLAGKLLNSISRKTISQKLGLVTQAQQDPFPMSVLEHALSGRNPHLGLLAWETASDLKLCEAALAHVSLLEKKNQDIQTLSGGERKRLAIARLLTQDPDIILWDEPTNHLDPAHQKQTLNLIRELQTQNKTQIVALHDVNHAVRIATHILFLMHDGQWCFGTVNEMLTLDALENVYQTHFQQFENNNGRYFIVS